MLRIFPLRRTRVGVHVKRQRKSQRENLSLFRAGESWSTSFDRHVPPEIVTFPDEVVRGGHV